MKYEWSNTLDEFLLRLQPRQEEPESCFGLRGTERILLEMVRVAEAASESEEKKAA